MANCIYIKIKGSIFIIIVLYMDDILLVSIDKILVYETMIFLLSNFNINDLGDTSYLLGIEIHRDNKRCTQPISKGIYRESGKKL
jgi:hypothetical protein